MTWEELTKVFSSLTKEQRQGVLDFVADYIAVLKERERRATAAISAPAALPERSHQQYDSGPGPWCEQCGATMGMRGGEWLCSSCSRYP